MQSVSSPRPFHVLGVQQIAVGGLDKQKLRHFWVDILGLRFGHTYKSEKENVDEDICETGAGAFTVEVDLMQPLDPDKKPKVHDPALNHVGLWIDDLKVAVAWLEEKGVRFTPGGIRKGAAGHDVCFIHPKGNDEFPIGSEGVLVELVQAPADVRQARSRRSPKRKRGVRREAPIRPLRGGSGRRGLVRARPAPLAWDGRPEQHRKPLGLRLVVEADPQDDRQRHREHHPHRPEHEAPEHQRRHHDERREPDVVSHHVGLDQAADQDVDRQVEERHRDRRARARCRRRRARPSGSPR